MQRVTISLDETLATAFDQHIEAQGYASRSEAVRDLVRRAIDNPSATNGAGICVANLSYVYNHHIRALAQRLTEMAHHQHDLVVATMHVHLDHENCLESIILKGDTARVQAFADTLRAERGVSFGDLNLVSVQSDNTHAVRAGNDAHGHSHTHGTHLTPIHAAVRARA